MAADGRRPWADMHEVEAGQRFEIELKIFRVRVVMEHFSATADGAVEDAISIILQWLVDMPEEDAAQSLSGGE